MDPNQNYPTQSKQRNGFIKLIEQPTMIGIVGVLVGLLLGYLLFAVFLKPQQDTSPTLSTVPPVTNTDPRLLLDPVETLKTPVFTEWGGSVEGVVVRKSDDTFTIEKSGRQLDIYLQQSLTGFYRETQNPQDPPIETTFEDLQIGDSVRGAVTISRETLDNIPGHHIFANVFTILNENTPSQ